MGLMIWIDGDACPRAIKDIIYKASQRTKTPVTLVANQRVNTPSIPLVKSVIVGRDFDAADNYIVQNLKTGDIVITADIPLADLVVSRKAHALNPRGELYTEANIKDRLSMRDLLTELRGGGVISGGPRELGARDIKNFAAAFDRILTKCLHS